MSDIGDITARLVLDLGDTLSQLSSFSASLESALEGPSTDANIAPVAEAFDQLAQAANSAEPALTGLQSLILDLVSTGEASTAVEGLAMALQAVGPAADASGLAEWAAQVDAAGGGASAASGEIESLGAAAGSAAGQMKLFGDAVDIPFADADGQLNMFAGDIQVLGSDATSAKSSIDSLNQSLQQTGGGSSFDLSGMFDAAKDGAASFTSGLGKLDQATVLATGDLGEMGNALATMGGIALGIGGLKMLAQDMSDASDSIGRAQISLSALTGDVGQAQSLLAGLEQLGMSDGLSMPGLRQAAISMEALLPTGTDIVGVLGNIADAAAVMGSSIDSVASKFDRMVNSGTLAARSIGSLGITMDDVKTAMETLGATTDQLAGGVTAAFKNLDPDGRVEVLTEALSKFKGVAEDVANNTFGGLWQQAANTFEQDMAKMGDSILPLVQSGFPSIIEAINETFADVERIKEFFNVLSDAIAGVVAVSITAVTGLGTAFAKLFGGDWSGAVQAVKDLQTQMSAEWHAGQAQIEQDVAAGQQKIAAILNAPIPVTFKLVPNFQAAQDQIDAAADMAAAIGATIVTVSAKADSLASHFTNVGKSAALSMAQAEAAVSSFDNTATSGVGTVGTLQAAFENASKAITLLAKGDLPAAIQAVTDYNQAMIDAGAKASVLEAGFAEESKLLNQLGKTDLPAAEQGFSNLTQAYLAGNAPLALVNAAFAETEKQINAIAKTDLPAALAMQEAYNAVLQSSGAPANILNDAFAKTDAILKQMAAGGDLQGAADGFTRLIAEEESAGASVAKITQTFQDQQKVFDQMAAAGNFQGAIDGLNGLADAEKSFAPNGDAFVKTLQDEQRVLDQMAATNLQGAIDGLDKLADKETALNAPTQVVTATLDDERSKLDLLANTNIEAAIAGLDKLAQHQIALNQPTQDVTKTLDDERSKLDLLANTNLEAAISGLDRLANEQIKLNQPTQDVTKTLDDERSKLDLLANTNIEAAIQGLSNLADEQVKLNQPAKDVTATLDDERSKIDQLANTNLPQAISELDALADAQVRLNQPAKDVTATLDDERSKLSALATTDLQGAITGFQALIDKQIAMKQPAEDVTNTIDAEGKAIQGMAGTDLVDATAKMGDFVNHLITIGSTATQVAGQMSAWEGMIQKEATVNLPAAIAQQELYIASLVRMGAQIDQIDAATIKADQMQIQLATDAVQAGDAGFGAASQYVAGIEKITLAEQAAHDEAVGFADMLVDGVKGLQTAWDSMDKTIADTIVNGGNWGAAWHTILKQFETDILEGVIKGALQPLEGLLLGLISSLITGVPSALSITGAGITALSANAGLAGAALTNLAASANAAAAGISASVGTSGVTGADGADAGGSGVLGALSNMADTLNLIANVIQAGAAVVGDVYLAAIDTKLFTVETDLNGILHEAENLRADQWNQFNGMMDRLGECKLDLDTILVTLQAMYAGGTGGGGLGDKAQSDLDTIASNSALTAPGDQAIDGTLLSILAQDQTIQTNTGEIVGDLQMLNSTLLLVNQSVLAVVSAINYHQQQTNSLAESMSLQAGAVADSGHAIVGAVNQGNSDANTRATAAQNAETAAEQANLTAAQSQYSAALSVAAQITALQSALTADTALMNLALQQGDITLATQYQTAAEQLRGQLTSLEGSVGTVNTSVDRSAQDIVSASNEVGVSTVNAGTLVSTAVSSAAAQITDAVMTASADSAAVTSAAFGQLISIIGAFGAAGGGLPGSLSGLPSGSGGASAPYGGLGAPDAAPGYGQQPSGTGSGSPAFSPGSGSTSGMTQAQWNATGHSGLAPDWWLNGTPQPGINEGGIPHFDDGGYVTADTLAMVHSGETVIPPGLTTSLGDFLTNISQLGTQDGPPAQDTFVDTNPITGAQYETSLELAQQQVDAQNTYLALAEANAAPPAMIDLLTKQLASYQAQLDAVQGIQKSTADTATAVTGPASKFPVLDTPTQSGPASKFPISDNPLQQTVQTVATNSAYQLTAIQALGQTSGYQLTAVQALGQDAGYQLSAIQTVASATNKLASAPVVVDPNNGLATADGQHTLVNVLGQQLDAVQQLQQTTVYVQQTVATLPGALANLIGHDEGTAGAAAPLTGAAAIASISGQGYYSGGYDPTPGLRSFDMGGFVPQDMVAMVHAGEYVLSPDMVRASMNTGGSTGTSALGLPAAAAAIGQAGSGTDSHDTYNFAIYGIQDPDTMARQLSTRMKQRSPKMGAYGA